MIYIFIVWTGSKEELTEFKINKIHPTFHFTFELNESEITLLDVKLFKGDRFKSEHILDIKTHIKSTNSHGLSLVYP